MTDKDVNEILRLLGSIEDRLRLMNARIIDDKIESIQKTDSKVASEAVSNVILLSIDIYIIFVGYNYLTSTKSVIQPAAVIGVVGIAFFIINSVLTTSRNIYSSYKAWGRHREAKKSFRIRIKGPLSHLEQQLSTIQPNIQIPKENSEIMARNIKSIEDDLAIVFGKLADELATTEPGKNKPLSNNERQDVRQEAQKKGWWQFWRRD